jgi:hypothetical protein
VNELTIRARGWLKAYLTMSNTSMAGLQGDFVRSLAPAPMHVGACRLRVMRKVRRLRDSAKVGLSFQNRMSQQ